MSVQYSDRDRILALGGIYQAARLVRDLAREGNCDQEALDTSLNTLFIFDTPTVAAVFGSESGVARGLRALVTQLEEPRDRDIEIAQYVISLIHLADKLRSSGQELDAIGDALNNLQRRLDTFELNEQTRDRQLADIYQEHVSSIAPQIMVKGEPLHLQNPDNASRIRSVLLSGVRCAILWRQTGGKKRQLLFSRRKIAQLARDILNNN